MFFSTLSYLKNFRKELGKIVVTNGCFDILHVGHVSFLKEAARHGDFLLVGVNSDESVKKLKGPTRPINPDWARAEIIEALGCVDAVYIFNDCTRFLDMVEPDVYCKAGDYTLETLNKDELSILQKHKSKIVFAPFVNGYSTTKIIEKVSK